MGCYWFDFKMSNVLYPIRDCLVFIQNGTGSWGLPSLYISTSILLCLEVEIQRKSKIQLLVLFCMNAMQILFGLSSFCILIGWKIQQLVGRQYELVSCEARHLTGGLFILSLIPNFFLINENLKAANTLYIDIFLKQSMY